MIEQLPVLDHGYVKYVGHMGSDETVIEAARMSTGKGFQRWEKDAKLLDFLYRHHHSTPFEMCELAIEVQAPIFVFREWMRHRTQSYNELSARYTWMPNLHYVPSADRFLPKESSNKQESSEFFAVGTNEDFRELVEKDQQSIYKLYEGMLSAGVPKEVARLNTPVSRYSRMRAKTDLRNWLGFLNLRMRENAQWEIREYAGAVGKIIESIWPRTYALFLEYDLNAKSFSSKELEVLRESVDLEAVLKRAESTGMSSSKIEELRKKLS